MTNAYGRDNEQQSEQTEKRNGYAMQKQRQNTCAEKIFDLMVVARACVTRLCVCALCVRVCAREHSSRKTTGGISVHVSPSTPAEAP